MQKLSLTNKKIIFSIILSLFILSGFFLNFKPVLAGATVEYANPRLEDNRLNFFSFNSDSLFESNKCKWPTDKLTEKLLPWKEIVGGLIDIIVLIPGMLADIASRLSSFMIEIVLQMPIIKGEGAAGAFKTGWIFARDLGNMIIVLGFVIIGVATALRIREYEAKQFFGKLVLAALLINFSSLMCGMIIDASNLTMSALLNTGGANNNNQALRQKTGSWLSSCANPQEDNKAPIHCMATTFYRNTESTKDKILCAFKSAGNFGKYASGVVTFSLVFLAIAVAFICFALLLLVRFGVLGVLYIFSPLALVFWFFPFPGAKALGQKWAHNFIKWAFSGVILCFFLWLASNMLIHLGTSFGINLTGEAVPQNPDINTYLNGYAWYNVLFFTLVAVSIIIIGIVMTIKTAPGVASAVMSTAVGVAGMAAGAVVGGAGKMIANTPLGQKVAGGLQNLQNRAGRTMERAGLRQTGATTAANSKRLEEQSSLMAKEYAAAKATGDTTTVNRIRQLAQTGSGYKGAAAVKVIADAKDLHKTFDDGRGGIDMARAQQRLRVAETFGATEIMKNSAKAIPTLKSQHEPTVNEIMGKRNPAADPARTGGTNFTKPEARREATRQQHASLGVGDLRSLPDSQFNPELLEDVNNRTFKKAGDEFSTEQIDQCRELIKDFRTNPANAVRARYDDLKATERALRASGNTDQADYIRRQKRNLLANVMAVKDLEI